MNLICLDGKFFPADEPIIYADNKAFRYGDAVFETIKIVNGKIPLIQLHFERLFQSLHLLEYLLPAHFSEALLQQKILELAEKNKCVALARIRLTVFRGHGGLYDENKNAGYLIEAWPLNETLNSLNENGLIIDILPDATKSCDKFSNLKSANFLLYSLAAQFAKKQQLNECLVLNTKGTIADGSITNLFFIRSGKIFTPALEEGCVNGVMRRFLIKSLKAAGADIKESAIAPGDLLEAEEIFLTNAVQGIKWVKEFRGTVYTNIQTQKIYTDFVKPLFFK